MTAFCRTGNRLARATQGMAQRLIGVVVAVALVGTMTVLPARQAHAATTTVQVSATYQQTEARKMLSMINDFRASSAQCWNENNTALVTYSGLQPLTYDYNLERVAMLRAAELSVCYSHERPNGQRCFTAFSDLPLYTMGENIAAGYRCLDAARDAFVLWREDNEKYAGQGHRRNMLNSGFASVGISFVKVNGVNFWVQNFGAPNTNPTATPADNSRQLVSVEVDESKLLSKKLALSSTTASLQVGRSTALPSASLVLETEDCWPSGTMNAVANNVQWTSENPAIAEVSGGKIVAKAVGKTKVTASCNGARASMTVTVTPVQPAATSLKKVKGAKKALSITWAKQTKNVSGYEVWCSTSSKFTKSTTVKKTVAKSKTSLSVKKLKAKKTYYVKVRTYNKDAKTGLMSYSKWSSVKKATTK